VERLLHAHLAMGSFHDAARLALAATIDHPISQRRDLHEQAREQRGSEQLGRPCHL
jgi:hypothetical protein